MGQARPNGKAYDSADVRIAFFGYVEDEITSITYNSAREHQNNNSLSGKATSWSWGKDEHTCSMTLSMAAVARLEKICKEQNNGNANLVNLKPFPINVNYFNDDQQEINDRIWAKFKGQGRSVTGEMGLSQEFEMHVVSPIEYHI